MFRDVNAEDSQGDHYQNQNKIAFIVRVSAFVCLNTLLSILEQIEVEIIKGIKT